MYLLFHILLFLLTATFVVFAPLVSCRMILFEEQVCLYEPRAAKLISLPHFSIPMCSPFNDQPLLGEKNNPNSYVLQ
jgi:hypothetical protein